MAIAPFPTPMPAAPAPGGISGAPSPLVPLLGGVAGGALAGIAGKRAGIAPESARGQAGIVRGTVMGTLASIPGVNILATGMQLLSLAMPTTVGEYIRTRQRSRPKDLSALPELLAKYPEDAAQIGQAIAARSAATKAAYEVPGYVVPGFPAELVHRYNLEQFGIETPPPRGFAAPPPTLSDPFGSVLPLETEGRSTVSDISTSIGSFFSGLREGFGQFAEGVGQIMQDARPLLETGVEIFAATRGPAEPLYQQTAGGGGMTQRSTSFVGQQAGLQDYLDIPGYDVWVPESRITPSIGNGNGAGRFPKILSKQYKTPSGADRVVTYVKAPQMIYKVTARAPRRCHHHHPR